MPVNREEFMKQVSERIDLSIKYEWTGGFQKKFLLEFIEKNICQ